MSIRVSGAGGSGGTGSLLNGIVAPIAHGSTFVPGAAAITTANRIQAVRCVVPKSGTLKDLSIWVSSAAGNIRGAVYDAGQAAANNHSLLWQGSSALAVANSWNNLGNPNIQVTKGQHLYLALVTDNVTGTYGRAATTAGSTALPADYFDGNGASESTSWFFDNGSMVFPNTILGSAVAQMSNVLVLLARVL